jgi:hypothetical protein
MSVPPIVGTVQAVPRDTAAAGHMLRDFGHRLRRAVSAIADARAGGA